jgi:phospholipase/carboxylesterase
MQSFSAIELNPAKDPVGTIIFLHGLGADGNDFVPMAAQINTLTHLPLRYVFPNAPLLAVSINNGYVMPAWYDIKAPALAQDIDHEGIAKSVKQLEKIIEQEKSLGISTDKIVVGGFSQGAVVALTTGVNYDKRLAGIIALSGYLPFSETDLTKVKTENHSTPIFIGSGTQDTLVPFTLSKRAYDLLTKLGFNATLHSYLMAHSVCDQEIYDICAWITKIFS